MTSITITENEDDFPPRPKEIRFMDGFMKEYKCDFIGDDLLEETKMTRKIRDQNYKMMSELQLVTNDNISGRFNEDNCDMMTEEWFDKFTTEEEVDNK